MQVRLRVMHPLRALLIYLAVVFLGGPLLAPWVYWGVHQAPWLEGWTYLQEQPFRRYVNRCMLVFALLGMVPLIRAFGAKSAAELGLVNPVAHWRKALGGFALGFTSLAVIVVLCFLGGVRGWDDRLTVARFGEILLDAAVAAVGVSILEELLFRGAIFGAFRRVMHWVTAAVISSSIYGILHFMKRVDELAPDHWYSGLVVLGHMLSGFANWHEVIPGFFNLTLAGLLLAVAYQRTGNLWFSIGLHAGWIFWRRAYGALTDEIPLENGGFQASFYGGEAMTDGWLAVVVLVVSLGVLCQWRFRRTDCSASPQPPS